MADTREIVGWFFKNGKRIPIRQKSGESPKTSKYKTATIKPEYLNPGESADRPYTILERDEIAAKITPVETTLTIPSVERVPIESLNIDKSSEKKLREKAINRQIAKTDRNEVLFIDGRGAKVRNHAEIVPELPEKSGKFDLGYSKIGTYQYDHGTYDIHHDRNRFDQFSYYAIPKIGRENVKRDPVAIRKAIKQPGAQAIKRVMQERGLDRNEAIKYLMEQRKK